MLVTLWGSGQHPQSIVFRNRYGRRWDTESVNRWFRKAIAEAVKAGEVARHKSGFSLYSLKHCAISIMLAKGVKLPVVSRIAGVDVKTLMTFYCGELLAEQAAALKAVWG